MYFHGNLAMLQFYDESCLGANHQIRNLHKSDVRSFLYKIHLIEILLQVQKKSSLICKLAVQI